MYIYIFFLLIFWIVRFYRIPGFIFYDEIIQALFKQKKKTNTHLQPLIHYNSLCFLSRRDCQKFNIDFHRFVRRNRHTRLIAKNKESPANNTCQAGRK